MSKAFKSLSALLILIPTLLWGQEQDVHPMIGDKFMLNAGIFFPEKEFEVQVNGSSPGREIDFGDRFRINSSDSTGAANFRWRFGEKWSVAGQFWTLNDSSTATLDEDISWEDVVIEEGTFVKGYTEIDVARVFFGRSFSKSEQHEFGLGFGLHWLEVGAGIEAQLLTSEGNSELYRGAVKADAPLPNIGAWYTYAFSSSWAISTRLDWLSASIGDYSGGLTNAAVSLDWAIFEHFGAGISYNYFNLNLDVDKNSWRGGADVTQHGPYLQINVHW